MCNVTLPSQLTVGHSEFTPNNLPFTQPVNIITPKETLQQRFIDEYECKKDNISYIVVAVLLPTGAIEIITNTKNLHDKYNYYVEMYDIYFHLKANTMFQIVNFMIV